MGAGVFSTACISPVGYSPGLFSSSSDQELLIRNSVVFEFGTTFDQAWQIPDWTADHPEVISSVAGFRYYPNSPRRAT